MLREMINSNKHPDGNRGYYLYVFDICPHQIFRSAEPIKVRFGFRPAVTAATKLFGYAPPLTIKVVSVTSDGQRHSDLI